LLHKLENRFRVQDTLTSNIITYAFKLPLYDKIQQKGTELS